MMKKSLWFLSASLGSSFIFAENKADSQIQALQKYLEESSHSKIEDFTFKGWEIERNLIGDLNKDGIDDTVLIWTPKTEDENNRVLSFFLKEKDHFKLKAWSPSIISASDEGGTMGDPLQEVSLKNGVITIMEYGGSRYRWETTTKIRYQNNQFEVMGYTQIQSDTLQEDVDTESDCNLNTQTCIIKKSQKGKTISKESKTIKDKKFKSVEISKFNPKIYP